MATFTMRTFIDQIIADDGYDSPLWAVKIVEFRNSFSGEICWGVIYEGDQPNKYDASEYILGPITIWEKMSL